SQGLTGAGVGVAVVDSGVNPTADLGSRLYQVHLRGASDLTDIYGHGTFVTGVLAGASVDGRHVGIAPGSTVYGLNVSQSDGSVYTSDVVNALNWILQNKDKYGIRVVNLSLQEAVPSTYTSDPLDWAV